MRQANTNIQDLLLNQLKDSGEIITVFMVNGFQNRGKVLGYDSFTILLEVNGSQQLLYKHAISTIVSGAKLKVNDGTKKVNPKAKQVTNN
ncbi:RNA chaperone Hfq [Niallia taxi]|uniref:RNA chaperone Hfq n=1 Tax=Niallia taxi TaxID=2499688 RepID=UPI0015F66A16|nr:RNA chaperone Hfq [Niallia taxi]